MFQTTIAGSLPKPSWLAEPNRLWAPWRLAGVPLDEAKRDATVLALKLQEDCGIDIVTDGEQFRQHFVHGFLEFVDGIDFARKVEIGIRADRYKAMVPTVTGELRLRSRAHQREAQIARAHTRRIKALDEREHVFELGLRDAGVERHFLGRGSHCRGR
jgi:5-methyltetrahydropteroyltriglutamate--homocysteine methyltransferase